MISAFLQEAFRLLGGTQTGQRGNAEADASRCIPLNQAVEHVVDETYGRLRAVPGYAERLKGPIQSTFLYIEGLVQSIPDAILCCRSTFVSDPRVNAFFAGPDHLREIFSQSEEVRNLFAGAPGAQECWALLCMHKEERRQLGMALQGGKVRKEVMQTGVSFTAHHVISPGISEEDARRALKCCIFNSLITYIRRRTKTLKEQTEKLENRRRMLSGRIQHRQEGAEDFEQMQAQLQEVEEQLEQRDLRLDSLREHLEFVADVLAHPSDYVEGDHHELRLNRLGIKLEEDAEELGYTVPLSEIRVACHQPRIATLVRFPREELLPQQDYLKKADLFLAV